MKIEPTDEFIATDEHGQTYRVIVYTTYVDASTIGSSEVWEEGSKQCRLDDGSAVNRISKTVFEIVSSGVRLTRQSE